MIIKKNMDIKMEVTPEIVIEFFKAAEYNDAMTVYNGMPESVKKWLASKYLSDLAQLDREAYERFIGVRSPDTSSTDKVTPLPEKPQKSSFVKKPDDTNKNLNTKKPARKPDDFKVGDIYKNGNTALLAITKITDDYVYAYALFSDDGFDTSESYSGPLRKDVFRFMINTGLIEKITLHN